MRTPSGEQYEISFEDQRAVVTGVGGGLRTYTVAGRNIVDGYGVAEMATGGRGQVLIPWPNRLQDGTYEFGGREHHVPLNEPGRGNAIHGLVRWVTWTAVDDGPGRIFLNHDLHPQPGYPFALSLQLEYTLSARGLRVTTNATNVGADACPFGIGFHPYLTVGTELVDEVHLRIPARTALRLDDRGIPVGYVSVDDSELDFRAARLIGEAKLDHGFTDLERSEDGLARVELGNGDDRAVTLWVDQSYPYLMVFTGDIPDVKRTGLAVEPMSCPPNAFRSGDGLVVLEPGGSCTGTWGIAPR